MTRVTPEGSRFLYNADCASIYRTSVLHKPYFQLIAAFTRSGRNGVWRRRTPMASNTALLITVAVGQVAGSPAPYGGYSGRLFTGTISMRSEYLGEAQNRQPIQLRPVTCGGPSVSSPCGVRLEYSYHLDPEVLRARQ
jgi:hypothetical protein